MCHYCPSSQDIDHRGRLEFIVTSNLLLEYILEISIISKSFKKNLGSPSTKSINSLLKLYALRKSVVLWFIISIV